jgi:hypothetical protein
MDKVPPRTPVSGRRSAGMLGSPRGRRAGPAIGTTLPARQPAPPPQDIPRASVYPRPVVLMGEATGPRGRQIGEYRQAFRAFMTAHRLRPSEWAKKADVPLGEIMAYLTGHQRFIAPDVAQRLADAAGVPPEALFK